MRLIKQSLLYFKEGNSDKVYEIDLCDVGDNKYVVNFRYGRKGSTLKEGSKTPIPVSLADAEKIFGIVEEEKLNKSYTTSTDGTPSKPTTSLQFDTNISLNTDWMSQPASRNRAILERLHHAVQGTASTARTSWKLSRVIWKTGEYKIIEAVPYIIKLYNKGDTLHQYVCTWALARMQHESTVSFLQSIFTTHTNRLITKIAGAGLLVALTGSQKEQHATQYLNALPDAIKAAVDNNQPAELNALLKESIAAQNEQHHWLESIYLLSIERKWLRPLIKQLLQRVPFKPGYFKQVRSIFKLSELFNDFDTEGTLATRFEREMEFFENRLSQQNSKTRILFSQLEERVNPTTELRKDNSRLAWSQRSKWYLHRRIRRRLQLLGKSDNTDYVKLATSILISYNKKQDFKEPYSNYKHSWSGRKSISTEIRFPQNAHAVFLHQLLSGEHPQLLLEKGKTWRLKTEAELLAKAPPLTSNREKKEGGLLKKIANLFGKKKEVPAPIEQTQAPVPNENGTPFIHLWNEMPQSYVQLLMEGQLEEVHEFAIGALTAHPKYSEIKEKLDKEACKKLLLSPFALPAEFGFKLVSEKYQQPDADLVAAMLNSINDNARSKGKQLTETNKETYFQNSDFVQELVFAVRPEIVSWCKPLLKNASLSAELKNAVVGRSIARLMGIVDTNEESEQVINNASNTLFEFFEPELRATPIAVIADLLQHPVPVILLFGLRLLKTQKDTIKPDSLNRSLLFGLLQHDYAPVRAQGVSFLNEVSDEVLLNYQDEIIAGSLSTYQHVRQGLFAAIDRMAKKDNTFGIKAAEALMPYLWHKETSEGLHADLSHLLSNELSNYLQNVNKETALKLLYSNYEAAQNVGVTVLEKYTDPSQLTIPQVIALSNHENLNVRTWSWKFYTEQAPRVKYEKEAAIKLLESKWEDTRAFAKQYFRDQFTDNDWSPEALITLADSVKPDIEAYGRELITRFFDSAHGEQYLLKLSQHPGEKMQLFATNYLERFAGDDVAKLQSLEFYFRSVLTKVNKSRIAKSRIYQFLLVEGRKCEEAAKTVCAILSDVSAIAAIGDKAKCIEIMLQLKALYAVEIPLQVRDIETRSIDQKNM